MALHFVTVRAPLIAAIVAMGFANGLSAAHAQFLDWGGEKKEKSAGKQTVHFNSNAKPGDVIVSFGDKRLYYITKPGEALSYPVAIPREQDRWAGSTRVSTKREKPSWTPTEHMRAENPRLPSWVPGGHPMNPLGTYAMYLGDTLYRIHGTDAPWTIGTAVSKGCVRMYNQDAADLYPRVKVGAKVVVTYDQFKTGATDQNVVADTGAPKELSQALAPRVTVKSKIATGSLPAEADPASQSAEHPQPSKPAKSAKKEKPKAKFKAAEELAI